MITIEQLLESVELDFESRWVIKDEDGNICIFEHKPETYESTREWVATVPGCRLENIGKIKLAEFENKPWSECIYEVPRKTTGKIEPIYVPRGEDFAGSGVYAIDLAKRLNQVIDAVNELKGAKND